MQSLVLRNLLHPYYQIIDEDKWVDPEGGGGTGGPDPHPQPEKSQNIGFLSNTGLDLLKNHKATKPAFIVVSAKPHLNGVLLEGQ